jgi:hypothetical protein
MHTNLELAIYELVKIQREPIFEHAGCRPAQATRWVPPARQVRPHPNHGQAGEEMMMGL